uniref:Uncharacterized protein n=1 Tax=Kalanchoe fedtschenkoi TaxID=63787 RepID=A0A7N0ZS07_KALFE
MQKEGGKGLVHSNDTIRNRICIGESSNHAVSGYEQDMRLARELSEGDLLSSRQADHTESSVHERSHSSSQHITIRSGNEVKRGVRESTCLKPVPDKTKSSLDRENNMKEQPKSLGKVKGPQKHYKNKVKEQKLLKKMARRERIEAFLKKLRPDPRGKQMINDYVRILRRQLSCPVDIDRANAHFTRIYISLLPTEEENAKRKQLLTLLETLVGNEWPQAKLHVFGSCENSFGIINSDLDVCLSIDDENLDKSAFLLELAAVLKDGHLQNVEAVVRTRVPIVKFMDPSTGISCDISVNNYLPLVNTKLLRDYARLDGRLRQLALIVKHWAKSRGVNHPFNRTLSSYTYVLMCINFLQQREPVILPCLQAMLATYTTTVNGIECAFFDRVDEICHFGSNNESLSQLVWGFFNYWAYHHDYENDVVSVRTGSMLSKLSKGWETGKKDQKYTHFVSIEDPLDTTIDLGRVVDRKSIKILREEFERAAQIMQDDPQPWISLFETYVVPPIESFPLKATPIASS